MRKEQNSDDLLLDAILLRALEEENEELEEKTRAENEALTEEEDARLKALLEAAWKKERSRQRRNRYLLRTAACFAVMLVVSFSVVMNVQAWRTSVVNYVLTVFDDHGVLSPVSDSSTQMSQRYFPTYLPEGCIKEEIILDNEDNLVVCYYGKDDTLVMTYQIFYKDANALIDTEDAEIETLHIKDQDLIILSKDDKTQLIGSVPGTEYSFVISGKLTEEEIINVFYSLQLEMEE